MTFLETPRMPDKIAFGAVSGPMFRTTVVTTVSGFEKRNIEWTMPLGRWDISQAIKDEDDFDLVDSHFRVVMGRAMGFRMKDWQDYRTTITRGIVSGITTTTFQLQKTYPFGASTFARNIVKPLAYGFVLKDGNTTLTTPGQYTLDTTTGIVTTTAPRTAANLRWSGEFDVPVRYDTDELKAEAIDRTDGDRLLIRWASIPLLEIRQFT